MIDECKLTSEQVLLLMDGQRVRVSYSTLEEYGNTYQHMIELVPPISNQFNSDAA
jgi:hypothetical protein